MSKELEALERIRDTLHQFRPNLLENRQRDFKLVETALKRLEELEELKTSFDRQLEKKLKALEIIKEKKVDVFCLLFAGLDIYNANIHPSRFITQEEYDLLKEVLE